MKFLGAHISISLLFYISYLITYPFQDIRYIISKKIKVIVSMRKAYLFSFMRSWIFEISLLDRV